MSILKTVDGAIENQLDHYVEQLKANGIGIQLLGEFVEYLYKTGKFKEAQYFEAGLGILASKMGRDSYVTFSASHFEMLQKACAFATDYYMLRDLIYILCTTRSNHMANQR
jgi:hypothetical protein